MYHRTFWVPEFNNAARPMHERVRFSRKELIWATGASFALGALIAALGAALISVPAGIALGIGAFVALAMRAFLQHKNRVASLST